MQGSFTDFLICAVGANYRLPIFTFAADFSRFIQYVPIQLHQPRTPDPSSVPDNPDDLQEGG